MSRARWDIRSSSSSREERRGRTEGGREENLVEEVVDVDGMWSLSESYWISTDSSLISDVEAG
jgi:hypothetical protein